MLNRSMSPIDIASPEHVEIVIRGDSTVVHVNVNGVCVFRACQVKAITIKDERKKR